MTTRCKFKCDSVRKIVNHWRGENDPEFTFDVEFSPVLANVGRDNATDENKQFWKWTPSGKIQFTSINADRFQPGVDYYVDITPANV